jgi:hypothetical protein
MVQARPLGYPDMQKEHVMYALTGLAVEASQQGLTDFAEELILMTNNDDVCKRLATLLTESDEDDLVQFLIEERIKEEQAAKKRMG